MPFACKRHHFHRKWPHEGLRDQSDGGKSWRGREWVKTSTFPKSSWCVSITLQVTLHERWAALKQLEKCKVTWNESSSPVLENRLPLLVWKYYPPSHFCRDTCPSNAPWNGDHGKPLQAWNRHHSWPHLETKSVIWGLQDHFFWWHSLITQGNLKQNQQMSLKITEPQNGWARRGLWKSPCPNSTETWLPRTMSRQLLNVSKDGESIWMALGSFCCVFMHPLSYQLKDLSVLFGISRRHCPGRSERLRDQQDFQYAYIYLCYPFYPSRGNSKGKMTVRLIFFSIFNLRCGCLNFFPFCQQLPPCWPALVEVCNKIESAAQLESEMSIMAGRYCWCFQRWDRGSWSHLLQAKSW